MNTAQDQKSRALSNLRHLYSQMVGGLVKDSAQAKRIAEGLLGPAIQHIEQAARALPAGMEPVGYLIDWPDEPELGHYFAEEANGGARSQALHTAAQVQAMGRVPPCATCNDWGMIGGPSFSDPGEGGEPCPDCSAPAWEPKFDSMAPRQEELVVQFCNEISGPLGKPGRAPDPVRLLEMAEELYKAERDAVQGVKDEQAQQQN